MAWTLVRTDRGRSSAARPDYAFSWRSAWTSKYKNENRRRRQHRTKKKKKTPFVAPKAKLHFPLARLIEQGRLRRTPHLQPARSDRLLRGRLLVTFCVVVFCLILFLLLLRGSLNAKCKRLWPFEYLARFCVGKSDATYVCGSIKAQLQATLSRCGFRAGFFLCVCVDLCGKRSPLSGPAFCLQSLWKIRNNWPCSQSARLV